MARALALCLFICVPFQAQAPKVGKFQVATTTASASIRILCDSETGQLWIGLKDAKWLAIDSPAFKAGAKGAAGKYQAALDGVRALNGRNVFWIHLCDTTTGEAWMRVVAAPFPAFGLGHMDQVCCGNSPSLDYFPSRTTKIPEVHASSNSYLAIWLPTRCLKARHRILDLSSGFRLLPHYENRATIQPEAA